MKQVTYSFLKMVYMKSSFIRRLYLYCRFIYKNKYIPDFSKPKTFNEKINFRKLNAENKLFSICSDKIAVKNHVTRVIGSDIVIPNLFVGEKISLEELNKLIVCHGKVVLKANHNSGPVFILDGSEDQDELASICLNVNEQLKVDFGKLQNEIWYSEVQPRVLVEKGLLPEDGDRDLKDYKFHVFTDLEGGQEVILHVDFNRTSNHNRSYFNEDLEWLPFSVKYPAIKTRIDRPKNFETMLDIAKKLAEPFGYVRVDLYNISGKIYFGELTFAHESGCGNFTSYAYDLWMGRLWSQNPSV